MGILRNGIEAGLTMLAGGASKAIVGKVFKAAGDGFNSAADKIRERKGNEAKKAIEAMCASTPPPVPLICTQMIGLTESAGREAAHKAGFKFRILSRDGEEYIHTMDFRMDRVNVTITKEKITEAHLG